MPTFPDDSAGAASPVAALDAEDVKLVTLARSSRARTGAREGAAVRDDSGRTYTAASVELPSLRLSALRTAVAMAASSGVHVLEAAAVVIGSAPDADVVAADDLAAVRDLGGDGVPVHLADGQGAVHATVRT